MLLGLNSTTQSLNGVTRNLIYEPCVISYLLSIQLCYTHQSVAVDKSITYTPNESLINTLKAKLLNN